jgi:prophage regulatory protein
MKDEQPDASAKAAMVPHLLRLPAVLQITGLGRSTLYKMISEGKFPAPVKLSIRASAWRDDEVGHWTSSRPRAGER